jgi:hypothetical protein
MTTATATSEEWVSKEEAAALMGVKPRQVEKRAQAGYIEKRYLDRRLNERSARVQYSRADIVAFLAGTPNHCEAVAQDAAKSVSREVSGSLAGNSGNALALIDQTLPLGFWSTIFERRREPREPRAWLTLAEASEYSGLPVPFLSQLLRAELVYAIGRGPATWRIQRASLDGYGSEPHQ